MNNWLIRLLLVYLLVLSPFMYSLLTKDTLYIKEPFLMFVFLFGLCGFFAIRKIKFDFEIVWILIFFLLGIIGSYFAINKVIALKETLLFTSCFLLSIAIAKTKEARDKYLLFIFVLAASINAGFHILKTKNIPLFGYTVQSGLGNPNVLSHYLELALPMALFLV
ncbi:MAG: hypothetical protein AB1765_10100, partial [Candidatus Hydrogenedentota bacterium]